MNAKEKKEKKEYIASRINLANGRYKDSEIELLEDLVRNADKYDRKSETYKSSFTDWSSDGKYTREEETTFIFRSDHRGIHIDELYQYRDDNGQSGGSVQAHTTGREILRVVQKIFK